MAKLLDDLTDQDLRNELQRREGVRKEEERQKGLKRFSLLKELVRKAPLEALELFAPKHSGSDLCSDDSPYRAYAIEGRIECLRCYLIADTPPEPVEISFYVREVP